ncbi:MAG: hypothetical protein ABMA01_23080 [Chthoniobacteraceae bacterium]
MTALALGAALVLGAPAAVVRRAPAFSFGGIGGAKSLASLRGQAVVLLVAATGKTKALRKQIKNLQPHFHDLSSRGTVFVAAFADGSGTVPSNIPFVIAANGAAVAAAYGMKEDFAIAIIGPDGNLDLRSDAPVPGGRVLEVIKNTFEVQEKGRREIPKGPPGR